MTDKPKQIAVKVEHLTKTFRIPTESSSGIKQKLINLLKGKKGYREFTPLKDISFEIEEGDFFGIVGRNGSGKSTLLKSIANIYTPTKGKVHVAGTLVPFIELGVGFNPELTGRENVFLNGALLGFNRHEMDAMYDEIVEFAEIGDFMEEKLKNYSSGMQVRLAFSIAIRADGDILLLDEVLAVGDEAFQKKCYDYFEELKKQKKTVILVSHDMASVRRFCNKALLIDKGSVVATNDPESIADMYSDLNNTTTLEEKVRNAKSKVKSLGISLDVANDDGEKSFVVDDRMNLKITWPTDITIGALWVDVYKTTGIHVCNFVTKRDGIDSLEGRNECSLIFDLKIAPGDYYFDIAFWNGELTEKIVELYPATSFRIQDDWSRVGEKHGGITRLDHEWM